MSVVCLIIRPWTYDTVPGWSTSGFHRPDVMDVMIFSKLEAPIRVWASGMEASQAASYPLKTGREAAGSSYLSNNKNAAFGRKALFVDADWISTCGVRSASLRVDDETAFQSTRFVFGGAASRDSDGCVRGGRGQS